MSIIRISRLQSRTPFSSGLVYIIVAHHHPPPRSPLLLINSSHLERLGKERGRRLRHVAVLRPQLLHDLGPLEPVAHELLHVVLGELVPGPHLRRGRGRGARVLALVPLGLCHGALDVPALSLLGRLGQRLLHAHGLRAQLGALGQLALGEELGLRPRGAEDEDVALEVDLTLVPLQHVQAEEHVHGLLLQDGEGGGEEVVLDLQLGHVDPAQDLLRADALGDARPTLVDQPGDAAAFRGRLK